MKMWKVLAMHRHWVSKCIISESINDATGERRFTATIDGWRNWRIMKVQQTSPDVARQVIEKVRAILARIESSDDEVFEQSDQAW